MARPPPRLALRHGKVHTFARLNDCVSQLCCLVHLHGRSDWRCIKARLGTQPSAVAAERHALSVRRIDAVLLAVMVRVLRVILDGADAYRLGYAVILLLCWVRIVYPRHKVVFEISHVRVNGS